MENQQEQTETENETKRQKTGNSTDYRGSEGKWHAQGVQNKDAQLAKKLIGMLKQCLNQGLPDRQVAEKVLHVIQPFSNHAHRHDAPNRGKGKGNPNRTKSQSFYSAPTHRRVMMEEQEMDKTFVSREQGNQPPIVSFTGGDWNLIPVKITTPKAVFTALSESQKLQGNIVVAKDRNQVQELQDMWKSLNCNEPLTVVLQKTERMNLDGEDIWVTVKRGRSLHAKLEAFSAWRLGESKLCPWVKQAKPTKVKEFIPPEKVFVRITAPQHYRASFTDEKEDANPNDIVQELANWKLASVSQLIGGTWKWEQGKKSAQLVGHLKVPQTTATKLEQYSGHRGIFVVQTKVRLRNEEVMWIPRQPEESDDSYHRRVSTKARERRQGIKFRSGGGKDLGLKKLPGDDTSDDLIVVSALGVPKDWDADDFSKFLIAQNWKEIESLQRKSANRRAACWNFRGIPPKDQVNGPWKFYDDTEEFRDFFIHMSKAESRPPKPKQTWPMPPPKRRPTLGAFTQDLVTPESKDSNKRNGSIPATVLDTQESQQNERERSPRRQQEDSAKASASLEDNTRLPSNDIIQEYILKGWDRRDL